MEAENESQNQSSSDLDPAKTEDKLDNNETPLLETHELFLAEQAEGHEFVGVVGSGEHEFQETIHNVIVAKHEFHDAVLLSINTFRSENNLTGR